MMYRNLKVFLMLMMTVALACGFLHHLVPPERYNFERLHIFLFNLCSGGTLLIYYTEGRDRLSARGRLFLILALAFALAAFFQVYALALALSFCLAMLVNRVRVDHFGTLWPGGLLSGKEPVERKFHQAALLCLTLGLLLACLVLVNEYAHFFTLAHLTLDTFFLGFSFPLSLVSMSVIFSLMKRQSSGMVRVLKETAFWNINLGVIIFFLFILAGMFSPQVAVSSLLFLTVGMILYLYWHEGVPSQQKAFLTSGICFLLVTSVSGISLVLTAFSAHPPEGFYPFLLRLHAFTALYGWNLSGLAVIGRHKDFPLQLHSGQAIFLHWLTVLFLCPLGYFLPVFAVLAVLAYSWLLALIFFRKGAVDREILL